MMRAQRATIMASLGWTNLAVAQTMALAKATSKVVDMARLLLLLGERGIVDDAGWLGFVVLRRW